MKSSIIYSIALCLAAFVLPFMVACSGQEESLFDDTQDQVTLYLNIKPLGLTRSGLEDVYDNEKMHNVRVVVLHEDGSVEHNIYYSLDGVQVHKEILLKVTPNENKKVFLFANEESVKEIEGVASFGAGTSLSTFIDSYDIGTQGFEDAVNALYFTPDYSGGQNIPMSSMYAVTVPKSGTIEKEFYVVRVATKFTINFFNYRGEDVKVNNIAISSPDNKNFLMARVSNTEQNRTLFKGKTWIEWLKTVSDASSATDDYATTEAAGWLKDYMLPIQSDRSKAYTYPSPVTVAQAEFDVDHLDDIMPGTASQEFYLPESKNLKSGTSNGEQEYTLTLNIEGNSEPFVCKLPNLKALFRNTNVMVNVSMYKNQEMIVDVIPFSEVKITIPDYGLNRDDFTGFIIGKDEAGRKCWYDGHDGPYYLGPNKDASDPFVTINGKEYLLVYSDYTYSGDTKTLSGYERTAYNLLYIIEKSTRKKYLLDPIGRTGARLGPSEDLYFNKFNQRVWYDQGGDLDPDNNPDDIYTQFEGLGLNLFGYRILYEWDRYDWNKAGWWGWLGVYPKYWYDVLGNRYPWSEGNTEEKRKAKLGEWVQYLE